MIIFQLIKRIAAGERFVLALRNDGLLYAWGDNTSGQLGVEINNETTEDGTAIEEVQNTTCRNRFD